jgi:hypothetical protein
VSPDGGRQVFGRELPLLLRAWLSILCFSCDSLIGARWGAGYAPVVAIGLHQLGDLKHVTQAFVINPSVTS